MGRTRGLCVFLLLFSKISATGLCYFYNKKGKCKDLIKRSFCIELNFTLQAPGPVVLGNSAQHCGEKVFLLCWGSMGALQQRDHSDFYGSGVPGRLTILGCMLLQAACTQHSLSIWGLAVEPSGMLKVQYPGLASWEVAQDSTLASLCHWSNALLLLSWNS